MFQKQVIILFAVILSLSSSAQVSDTINITDGNGLKQGRWISKDKFKRVRYDGYFTDNKPSGSFKRFYEDGKLQSLLIFSDDGRTADAVFYHPNGITASKGKYINQQKEGKWQFFSSRAEGYLICEEEYTKNRKNGLSVKYYPDKTPSEKLTYINDVKTGEWIQYYPDGNISIKANYDGGKLDGEYVVYFNSGKPQFSGQYRNDARNGTWVKYNPDGSVNIKINYINGLATNPELYIKETQYLDSLELNKDRIADPEKTGTIWE